MLMLLTLFATPAIAASTIEAYMPSCEAALADPDDPQAGACIFYVGGVADVFTSHMLNWPACSPKGTTVADVLRTFVDWAHRNPDEWQENIFRGVIAAITERYRC